MFTFTLGREIDIQYATNRYILIITLVSTLLGMILRGDFVTGLQVGGTIFLTWVLGREIDPKREYSAFIGVAVAFAYSFLADTFMVSFLELAFIMLLLRLINRTCGSKPTLLDAGVIFGLAAYLYYSFNNPIFLILYVIGLFISQTFKEDQLFNIFIAAGAGFALGYLFFLMTNNLAFSSPILSPWFLILLTFLYGIVSYLDHDRKVYDDKGQLISSVRIVRAQLFFAFAVLVIAFLSDSLFGNMVAYIAAMAGAIIYRPLNEIFHFEK